MKFYIEHIQLFPELAAPLIDLLRKNSKFILDSKEIKAWTLLKAQTLKTSELIFFDSIVKTEFILIQVILALEKYTLKLMNKEKKDLLNFLVKR